MMMLFWMLFVLSVPATMGQNKSELGDCYNRTVFRLNYTLICNDTVAPGIIVHFLDLLHVTFSNDSVIRITDPVEDCDCESGEKQPCVFNAFDEEKACSRTGHQPPNTTLSFTCQPDVDCIDSEGTAILLYELDCNDTLPSQVIVIVRPNDTDDSNGGGDSCDTDDTNGGGNSSDTDDSSGGGDSCVIMNETNSTQRYEIDCDGSRQTCIDICLGTSGSECQRDLDDFCDDMIGDLLDPAMFCEDNVATVVDIIAARSSNASLNDTLDNLLDLFFYFDDFVAEAIRYLEDDNNTMEILDILDDLFDDEMIDNWGELVEEGATSSSLLFEMEELAILVGTTRNSSFQFSGINMVMAVENPTSLNIENGFYIFPNDNTLFGGTNSALAKHALLQIPVVALCSGSESTEGCSAVISSILMRNIPNYLDPESEEIPASYLLSAQVQSADKFSEVLLDNPAMISFSPLKELPIGMKEFTCFFWNFTIEDWSSKNIMTTEPDDANSNVLCTTTHLTSFAVLVSVNEQEFASEEEAFALEVVSYVGCSISIICLALTIFCLIAFRKILNKGSLLYIHLNLAVALFVGLVVFVAGIEGAKNVEWLCTLVAALLHYFFLCVFCWMLAEGIMLYLLVVRVFGTAAEKWYYLLILGWGVPLPIAAISAGVLHEDYGNDDFCWIDADVAEPAIWLFVGPMLIIMLINSVILVMTVVSMVRGRKLGGAETGVNTLQLVKTAIKGTVILLPLLGITWIIGIFAVNENTTVFAWLFTILNSLQGVSIFVLHVLRNEHLLAKLKRCICYSRGKGMQSSTGMKEGMQTSTGMNSGDKHTADMEMCQTREQSSSVSSTGGLLSNTAANIA